MAEEEDEADRHDRMLHWLIDFEDIRGSDFLALWAKDQEEAATQRGSLVEAGAAIALGKPVITIGSVYFGTWTFHPLVRSVPTISDLRREISGC